jgi:penicillin-binding protein-related factor A (putative recombinase)
MLTPGTIATGKDFEEECINALAKDERFDLTRNGVRSAQGEDGKIFTMKSLPDFSAAYAPIGREIVFDAKKNSAPSFPLNNYVESKSKSKQLWHLLNRSAFGSVTFFLIHWNERHTKTKHVEPATMIFPVHRQMPFWRSFLEGYTKGISLQDAHELGIRVQWHIPPRCRRPRMKLGDAISTLARSELFAVDMNCLCEGRPLL